MLIDGDVVLDGRVLRHALTLSEPTVLYDSVDASPAVPVQVEDGRLVRLGEGTARVDGGYIGVAVCPAPWLRPLVGEEGWPDLLDRVARSHPMRAIDLSRLDPYAPGLRRALKPFWYRIRSPEDAARCKDLLVKTAQKGTLDVVAWHVNRPLENLIVRALADLPITPNQVSLLTNLLAYGVPALFLTGRFLLGVLLALVVNVLDGVDGKLARVKGLTSHVGELEHSFDLLYEQSWYLAFYWMLYLQTHAILFPALAAAMLLLDSFSRHCSMQFKQVTGVSLSDYAPFDRRFRRIDGRRNIYSLHLLFSAVIGRPVVAAWTMLAHALLTAGIYAWRAALHLRRLDLGVHRRKAPG